MSPIRLLRAGLLGLLPLTLMGCEGLLDPDGGGGPPPNEQTSAAPDSLLILRFAPDSPPLSDTLVSFWAVRGENREVEIRYGPAYGYGGGECLRFRVPGAALLRRPDGTTIQPGDSLRITVRVVRSEEYHFEFQPAGLEFAADTPAELRFYYEWVDPDFNGDGRIDEEDARIQQRFGIWRQERPGERWTSIQTERNDLVKRARAEIRSFTRYALASN